MDYKKVILKQIGQCKTDTISCPQLLMQLHCHLANKYETNVFTPCAHHQQEAPSDE